MAALSAVRDLDLPDWAIGAGFVRALVWDRLSGHAEPTELGDVDVVYFDPSDLSPTREAELEAALAARLPGPPWSVKNQARMHVRNIDRPYRDTTDAIGHWLETATCVAVRLEADGHLKLLAPHGIADLVAMKLRRTPAGLAKRGDFEQRLAAKNWRRRWPKLAAFAVLLLVAAPAPAAELTPAVCETDFQAMLAAIAANRQAAVQDLDRQIAETDPERRPALKELREAAWTEEEHQRVQADRFRLDCLKAAKRAN
jgi:hypothetical protein